LVPVSNGYKDWKPADGDTLRINEYVALQNREIRKLLYQPVLSTIAARLVGTNELRLWESELFFKPPQRQSAKAAIGWHTDRAYWMTCTSEEMVSVWIPFHDCPLEMGPLTVVDGSHLWTDVDHNDPALRAVLNPDLDGREARLLEGRRAVRKVAFELKKGQVSFHHTRLLHASGFNHSNRPRISVSLHMQDRDNRYREHLNERGERWTASQDRMCRPTAQGTPDYTDPEICPVLFKRE
jgi:ectoine hydroxylase-related dioxygenase (phytanoyl-CoA dioxygenase family)